jgi:carbon-monoxide dehydrogenase catalytic subunit
MGQQDDPKWNISIQPYTLVLDTGAPRWPMPRPASRPRAAALAGPGLQAVCKAPPVLGSTAVTDLLLSGLETHLGAKFAVQPDPFQAAQLIIGHIEGKRRALGLDSR